MKETSGVGREPATEKENSIEGEYLKELVVSGVPDNGGEAICLIKPDAFREKEEIIRRLENAHLGVLFHRTIRLSEKFIREKIILPSYAKEVIEETMRHLVSGPSEVVLVRGGEEVVNKLLHAVGLETNPALCDPDSIRYLFGNHTPIILGKDKDGKSLEFHLNAMHRPRDEEERKNDLKNYSQL